MNVIQLGNDALNITEILGQLITRLCNRKMKIVLMFTFCFVASIYGLEVIDDGLEIQEDAVLGGKISDFLDQQLGQLREFENGTLSFRTGINNKQSIYM